MRTIMEVPREPPEPAASEVGGSLEWAALLAGIVACGVPLATGIATGWPPGRLMAYSTLTLLYLLLTQIHKVPLGIAQWLCRRLPAYLIVMGIVSCVLQSISGDPFVQPIVFTVPLVHAALVYAGRPSAVVGVFYLLLMALGLVIGGQHDPAAVLFPVASYGALMAFMYSFVRLSVAQAAARRQADELAGDLARQRDYLQRLVEVTATLTRDLDLLPVLELVAAEGRALAHAGQARIWLCDAPAGEDNGDALRLAAVVPPQVHVASPENGTRLPVAASSGSTLRLSLISKGARIGLLELCDREETAFSEDAARLLQPFADAAAVAIENARLYEQARLSATLAERNRLARELHDTIAQGLTAITMQIEAAQRSIERDPARARARISRAHELARATLDDVRRSVWTLASPLVDGLVLTEALEQLTEGFAARTGLPATYRHSGVSPELGHATATQVLRIAQEALQNVAKHAQATEVQVRSEAVDAELCVWVEDNGTGFNPDELAADLPAAHNGFGLLSIRERARLAGGTLRIESTPGKGTRVMVTVPHVMRDR